MRVPPHSWSRARAAAAELSILHARARLSRSAKVAYALDEVTTGNELALTRDELGRMVMQLREAEVAL